MPKGRSLQSRLEESQSSLLSQLSLPNPKPLSLFWCSFIAPDNSFIGVVICKGTSPGAAADWAIKSGIVESERASIVMIPVEKEGDYLPWANRLLREEEVRENFNDLVEKFSN